MKITPVNQLSNSTCWLPNVLRKISNFNLLLLIQKIHRYIFIYIYEYRVGFFKKKAEELNKSFTTSKFCRDLSNASTSNDSHFQCILGWQQNQIQDLIFCLFFLSSAKLDINCLYFIQRKTVQKAVGSSWSHTPRAEAITIPSSVIADFLHQFSNRKKLPVPH